MSASSRSRRWGVEAVVKGDAPQLTPSRWLIKLKDVGDPNNIDESASHGSRTLCPS